MLTTPLESMPAVYLFMLTEILAAFISRSNKITIHSILPYDITINRHEGIKKQPLLTLQGQVTHRVDGDSNLICISLSI